MNERSPRPQPLARITSLASIASLALCSFALGACNTAAVERSYMSLDQDGSRKRTTFYTDTDTIYCIGELAIGRKDVSVTAALLTTALAPPPSGKPVPLASTLAVKDVTPGGTGSDILTSFQLIKADEYAPWPAGSFECELSIDGELAATNPFQILYPDCPVAPPNDAGSCAGFFLSQSKCVGALSAQTCVCSDNGVWQCR